MHRFKVIKNNINAFYIKLKLSHTLCIIENVAENYNRLGKQSANP